MKVIFCLTLTVTITSCNRKACTNSIVIYSDLYQCYLIILEDSKHPRKLVTPKEINEAVAYLEAVSGISSNADRQHYVSYQSKSEFNNDLHLWKECYETNLCVITAHYIDSLINRVGLKID